MKKGMSHQPALVVICSRLIARREQPNAMTEHRKSINYNAQAARQHLRGRLRCSRVCSRKSSPCKSIRLNAITRHVADHGDGGSGKAGCRSIQLSIRKTFAATRSLARAFGSWPRRSRDHPVAASWAAYLGLA